MHPNGQIPGLRVGLWRCEPAGARLGRLARLQDRPEAHRRTPTPLSWSASFTSCCSTSPGGSTAKTPRAATSFRAASWGWTTSACSTAARRCPTGGYIEQADGTGWMGMYCLNLLAIALELARTRPGLRGRRHQVLRALHLHRQRHQQPRRGRREPVGRRRRLLLRRAAPAGRRTHPAQDSLAGRADPAVRRRDARAGPARQAAALPRAGCSGSLDNRPELVEHIASLTTPGEGGRRLLAIADQAQARPHPAAHARPRPVPLATTACARSRRRTRARAVRVPRWTARLHRVDYEPAESDHRAVRRQLQLARPDLVPGQLPDDRVAAKISSLLRRRATKSSARATRTTGCTLWRGRRRTLAPPDAHLPARRRTGRRPVFGGAELFQNDPHWRDYILFYEYFHGDNGAGLGASHQTGWTALVAKLIQQSGGSGGVRELGFVNF